MACHVLAPARTHGAHVVILEIVDDHLAHGRIVIHDENLPRPADVLAHDLVISAEWRTRVRISDVRSDDDLASHTGRRRALELPQSAIDGAADVASARFMRLSLKSTRAYVGASPRIWKLNVKMGSS